MTDAPVTPLPQDWQDYIQSMDRDIVELKARSVITQPRANERPWWAPDAQGFLAAAIVLMTFTALIIRMFHSSVMEDKMLDTMITILFSTCLVTVYNYSFGSSRGSSEARESQARVVEKLAEAPTTVAPVVLPMASPVVVTPTDKK